MAQQMGEVEWGNRFRKKWKWTTYASPLEMPEGADARVRVHHVDFPGWDFFVTFSPAGAAVGFEVQASAVVPVGVDVMWKHQQSGRRTFPREAIAPAITARFLRRLPVGEIQDVARQGLLELGSRIATPEVVEQWGQAFQEVKRPGRGGRGDKAYAEVAALYVEKLRTNRKTALKDLASDLGYSPSQVRNMLYEARSQRRGLLTKAEPGKAGGRLTDKALDLLRHDEGSK